VTPDQGFNPFEPLGPFELLVSNPPYVSRDDEIDAGVLLHEPGSALFPWNNDPGFFYTDFILRAKKLMAPGGAAFFEIPHERADLLEAEFQKSGAKRVSLIPDLTGRPRVLRAEF
jgi:release factor glutamine methyltransferase